MTLDALFLERLYS